MGRESLEYHIKQPRTRVTFRISCRVAFNTFSFDAFTQRSMDARNLRSSLFVEKFIFLSNSFDVI